MKLGEYTMCKAQAWPGKEDQSSGAARELFPFPGVFRDVHDVVLEDEQIRRTFPRQAHHVLVVILDPAPHNFSIRQFDADRLLFLAKGFQISGFFEGLIRRRSLPAAPGCARSTGIERHLDILHGGSTVNAETVTHVAGTFCYPSSPVDFLAADLNSEAPTHGVRVQSQPRSGEIH